MNTDRLAHKIVAPGAYRAPDETAEPAFDQANGSTGGASGEPEDRGHEMLARLASPAEDQGDSGATEEDA